MYYMRFKNFFFFFFFFDFSELKRVITIDLFGLLIFLCFESVF